MKTVLDLDLRCGEHVRLKKKLMRRDAPEEFPEQLKWSLQLLYLDGGRWRQVCRIDNYPHEGQAGSHIHTGERIERLKLSFEEAEKMIEHKGSRILKERYGRHIDL